MGVESSLPRVESRRCLSSSGAAARERGSPPSRPQLRRVFSANCVRANWSRFVWALCILAVGGYGGFALRGAQIRPPPPTVPSSDLGPTAPGFEPVVPREVVQRGIVSRGAHWRSERLVNKLREGAPVEIVAVGGSVTYGRKVDVAFPQLVANWINATYPNPDHECLNKALPAVTSEYFGPCIDVLVPQNADLVFVETVINDGTVDWRHSIRRNYERLLRGLLSRPYPPLVVPIMLFNYHQMQHNGVYRLSAEGEISTIGQYYDLPWLSTRQALFHFTRAGLPNATVDTFMTDDLIHPTDVGHHIIADIIVEYLRGEVAFHSAPPPPPPPPPPSPSSPSPNVREDAPLESKSRLRRLLANADADGLTGEAARHDAYGSTEALSQQRVDGSTNASSQQRVDGSTIASSQRYASAGDLTVAPVPPAWPLVATNAAFDVKMTPSEPGASLAAGVGTTRSPAEDKDDDNDGDNEEENEKAGENAEGAAPPSPSSLLPPPPSAHPPPPPWSFVPLEWKPNYGPDGQDMVAVAMQRARQLPEPMLPGLYDLKAEKCFFGWHELDPFIRRTKGFDWFGDRGDRIMGTTRAGAKLDLEVDTRGPNGEASAVLLYTAKSYHYMGKAIVRCISGCMCKSVKINGALRHTFSNQAYLDVILPTAHEKCVMRIRVLESTDTGENNLWLRGLGLSTTLAASPEHFPELWFGADMQNAPVMVPHDYIVSENAG